MDDSDSEVTCIFAYKIEISPQLAPNTTDHGLRIPIVVNYHQNIVQLSLTVDTKLLVNEEYYAILGAINANGEIKNNKTVSIEFGIILCMVIYVNNIKFFRLLYTGLRQLCWNTSRIIGAFWNQALLWE